MRTSVIDINCDVGEGIGNEAQLLPLISSCNIACTGHAGTKASIKEVALLAKQTGTKIGAHPSYPDKDNFGRLSIEISKEDLIASIQEQLRIFCDVISKENLQMHHIKAHGALYNDICKDAELAKTYLKAILPFKKTSFLYVPYASIIEKEALKQGFSIKREAFADRNYNADLSLVSRKQANALIMEPKSVFKHVVSMVKSKELSSIDGAIIAIQADTFCIHGDTKTAIEILMYLSKNLIKQNIAIANE